MSEGCPRDPKTADHIFVVRQVTTVCWTVTTYVSLYEMCNSVAKISVYTANQALTLEYVMACHDPSTHFHFICSTRGEFAVETKYPFEKIYGFVYVIATSGLGKQES